MCHGEGWTFKDEEYYYYDKICPKGGVTSIINTTIKNLPQDPSPGDEFNYILIWETTDVKRDQDGNPVEDWSGDIEEEGGGGEKE